MTATTFAIGGDLEVRRIGYGSMQLTGTGHWGPPADTEHARRVLRRAVDLGVNHIDTADAYGPHTVEQLIHDALHPYPHDLVIATKGGLTRQGPNQWVPLGRPEYLRQCVETSLRRLAVDHIDLYYLHRIDPHVAFDDQLEALAGLQIAGKIRHVGLSKVATAQLDYARRFLPVAAVQNCYHPTDRRSADLVTQCAAEGIAFVPYRPLDAGAATTPGSTLATIARTAGDDAAQLALAWLLADSPNVLPIPGTANLAHLTSNLSATDVVIDATTIDLIESVGAPKGAFA